MLKETFVQELFARSIHFFARILQQFGHLMLSSLNSLLLYEMSKIQFKKT